MELRACQDGEGQTSYQGGEDGEGFVKVLQTVEYESSAGAESLVPLQWFR